MAFLLTSTHSVQPRVSHDEQYVHVRLGAHNTLGLTFAEASILAADILEALKVQRFEAVIAETDA